MDTVFDQERLVKGLRSVGGKVVLCDRSHSPSMIGVLINWE